MGCGALAVRNIHHRMIENRWKNRLLGAIDCPPTNHEVGSSNLSGRANFLPGPILCQPLMSWGDYRLAPPAAWAHRASSRVVSSCGACDSVRGPSLPGPRLNYHNR